jgi:hypothetical protein
MILPRKADHPPNPLPFGRLRTGLARKGEDFISFDKVSTGSVSTLLDP